MNTGYFIHLPECQMNQNWLEVDQAMADTPMQFRDEGYYIAIEEINTKRNTCNCGLENFKKQIEFNEYRAVRLNEGWNYLMGVDPEKITVEDSLEAFGFGRNGLIL